jgi:Dehydrogenases with different specificities (related to short-chain alcohol dehydrogenases)
MADQKAGKIINMASINGLEHTGRPGTEAYSAAKAAIINFTKTIAKEYAPRILVNCVSPGKTKTSYYDQYDQDYLDKLTQDTPIKKFVKPEEVARAFVFLAKNDAITGENLVIDGGFSLKSY